MSPKDISFKMCMFFFLAAFPHRCYQTKGESVLVFLIKLNFRSLFSAVVIFLILDQGRRGSYSSTKLQLIQFSSLLFMCFSLSCLK